jgi:hypothetical protein
MARLSAELNRFFFEDEPPAQVSLVRILDIAGERIFGFLFVLLSLPSALPVPAPGYSIPFGVVMLVLSVQLIIGRQRPWLPQRVQNHEIALKTVQSFLKSGLPWLQRIEKVSRPRYSYICTSLPGRVIIGVAIALMSISMMVPIPGTNTLPAIGVFVTGFGLLDDDGAISLAGLVLCACGAALTGAIVVFGYAAVKATIEFLKTVILGG